VRARAAETSGGGTRWQARIRRPRWPPCRRDRAFGRSRGRCGARRPVRGRPARQPPEPQTHFPPKSRTICPCPRRVA